MKHMRRALAIVIAVAMIFGFRSAEGVVYWGQRGEEVTRVQQKLKQYGYFSGTVDGHFGQATYDAVVWKKEKRSEGGWRGGPGDSGGAGDFTE